MNRRLLISFLKESVIKGNPKLILKSLVKKGVFTDMPNKVRFYILYKRSVICLHLNSKGKIYLKHPTEFNVGTSKEKYLEFYDTYYTNPRMTMIIQEKNKEYMVSLLPF